MHVVPEEAQGVGEIRSIRHLERGLSCGHVHIWVLVHTHTHTCINRLNIHVHVHL